MVTATRPITETTGLGLRWDRDDHLTEYLNVLRNNGQMDSAHDDSVFDRH